MRECYPQALRRTLDKLPETLDATYERTLLGIEKTKREYAYRLFQCLVVSIRPLRVEELAEVLAVLLDTEEGSEYHVDWRPEDSQQSVLSTCSSLITIANVDGSTVVQFSHFSVKEFLMSSRLSNAGEPLSPYHILPHSSHTVIARASLSILLSLGDKVDKSAVENHPLALYASRYWVNHAKFEGVSSSIRDLMERLFDPSQAHFATWVWLYDMDRPWEGHMATACPMKPKATPLYYASLCGFPNLVKFLAITHPKDVDAKVGCNGSALHAAIAKGEVDAALELLQLGADKDSILDETGNSCLHRASQTRYLDLAELLLKSGVDINLRNTQGETPLAVALFRGNLEVAHFLIERGADVHWHDEEDWTLLHTAAQCGHLDMVQLLLDLDIGVDVRCRGQSTPLILASGGGHVEVSRLLIEHQADVTSVDDNCWTSLHAASHYGHADIVRLLLDHGEDVNVQQVNLWAPLHLASANGHLEVAELLIACGAEVDVRNEDQKTPLHMASKEGFLEIAGFLMKRGSNVDSQDTRGWTPLHSAAQNGHLDIVKMLLNSGADIGIQNGSDETAFDLAHDNGRREVVDFLTKYDGGLASRLREPVRLTSLEVASQNNFSTVKIATEESQRPGTDAEEEKTDDELSTLLHSAIEIGSIDAVKRLLDRSVDVDERDELLQTQLAMASNLGELAIVRMLINCGADVNCRDIIGWTVLHVAALSGHVDVVRFLLDKGADVNAMQRNDQTPLHLACVNGHLPVVLLLLNRGANVRGRNAYGRTPSQEASSRGYRKVAQLLSEHEV